MWIGGERKNNIKRKKTVSKRESKGVRRKGIQLASAHI